MQLVSEVQASSGTDVSILEASVSVFGGGTEIVNPHGEGFSLLRGWL